MPTPFEPSSSASSESSEFATISSSSSSSTERCGPDVTDWFINFTNAALRSDKFKTLQEMLLSVGAFHIQPAGAAYLYWALLVRPGGEWDMKRYLVNATTEHCPTQMCNFTVSISGMCVRSDTLGNMFYGIVGRLAGFGTDTLLWGANLAQILHTGTRDEPQDQEAIMIGFDISTELSAQYGGITYEGLAKYLKRGKDKIFTRPDCALCHGKWNN